MTKGYLILEKNWRTKFCEIDIITEFHAARQFVEVKYRSSKYYGGGIAAITPKKLRQMHFAAELYDARHPTGKLQQLVVATVDAQDSIELIEIE